MDGDAIRALLDRYCRAWAANDRAGWLATFADDATQEDPIGEGVRRGADEIGRFWDDAMAGYDGGITLCARAVHVAGGEAAMEWTIVAAGGSVETIFDGVDVFHFGNDGRIASVRAYWQRDGRVRARNIRRRAGSDVTTVLDELVAAVEAALDDPSLGTDGERAQAMAPAMARLIAADAPVPAWATEPYQGGAVGNLVHADAEGRFHVLVVVFPEGTSSGVHFHGCWGVIGYLRGGDEETRYVERDGVPVEDERRSWKEGDVAYLLPDEGQGWHRVRNPGPGTGVSVHVLCRTPADHPHRYWDRAGERILEFPFVEVAPDRWVATVTGLI